MAGKSAGMGDQWFFSGYDLGADTNSFSAINGGQATLPATAITDSAEARFGGERDGSITPIAYWNPDANQSHAVYSPLPTTDVVCSYLHGTSIGGWSSNMLAKEVDYQGARGQDGSFLLTVPCQANGYGMQWAQQATAGKRTDAAATAAGAVSPLDQLTATPGAFGGVMWVHLFSLASGSVTIKLQESSDNGADAYADVVGATTGVQAAAPYAARIATGSINVERYIKVVTTGTFTNAVFAVSWYRHRIATVY